MLLGLLFSGVVILIRLIWVYPGAAISYFIRRRFFHQQEKLPDRKVLFIIGWTGMRGVVALAAAISLPEWPWTMDIPSPNATSCYSSHFA